MTRFFYGVAVSFLTMYITARDFLTANKLTREMNVAIPSHQLAAHESLGFFTDITDTAWKLRKRLSREAVHHAKEVGFEQPMSSPRAWYQNNWNEDFSCFAEVGVGGIADGHKFVCDPHRLVQYPTDCLIYSFGSNGNFDFEHAINQIAPHCEIHIFDPVNYESKMQEAGVEAHYHAMGLTASYETSQEDWTIADQMRDQVMKTKFDFRTFQEILEELGHADRRIDVFKIDCEGCEYRTYKDWIMPSYGNKNADIRQVVVEVHDFPSNTNQFFQDFHDQGYVIFHKEPNIEWSGGDCVEFSFLKLHQDFFKEETFEQDARHDSAW
jgi:hypothetical protein